MSIEEPCFITLEEHFMTEKMIEACSDQKVLQDCHPGIDYSFVVMPSFVERLKDLGEKRIQDMDEGKVLIQILSHAPVCLPNEPTFETCHESNNTIAKAIQSNPKRFKGFAWLDMRQPEKASQELHLRISQGFLGAFLDDHTPDGRKYDDEFFWPVFETAEELDVPIYLHPTFPPSPTIEGNHPNLGSSNIHTGNYSNIVAGMLSSAGLSWHSETAIHILRLFSSGVFERFPKLKLILGHNGEGLPFFYDRICPGLTRCPIGKQKIQQTRSFETVWNENLWFTTSGMFGLAPIACMVQVIHPSRIMYSLDYPFSLPGKGLDFMKRLKESGLVTNDQWEAIGWGNAKKLLNL